MKKIREILIALFGRDYQFALATTNGEEATVRYVDTYFDGKDFYIVTYAKSRKVQDILVNPNVSLTCRKLYTFSGKAEFLGHPLKEENKEIRGKLIKEFEYWYFAHNNENDENMCYVKITPTKGFFYSNGNGYNVDFLNEKIEEFPFTNGMGYTEE